jgi:hypothetical protein
VPELPVSSLSGRTSIAVGYAPAAQDGIIHAGAIGRSQTGWFEMPGGGGSRYTTVLRKPESSITGEISHFPDWVRHEATAIPA